MGRWGDEEEARSLEHVASSAPEVHSRADDLGKEARAATKIAEPVHSFSKLSRFIDVRPEAGSVIVTSAGVTRSRTTQWEMRIVIRRLTSAGQGISSAGQAAMRIERWGSFNLNPRTRPHSFVPPNPGRVQQRIAISRSVERTPKRCSSVTTAAGPQL